MKSFPILISFFLVSISLFSQQKFPDGDYLLTDNVFNPYGGQMIRITDNTVKSLYVDSKSEAKEMINRKGFTVKETSSILNNNVTCTTISMNSDTEWTTTITKNIFYFGNPFVYRSNYNKTKTFVPNFDNSFDKEESSKTISFEGYARLRPQVYVEKKFISTGGTSTQGTSIEQIRITDKSTEITILIEGVGGSIHPPNNDKAYYISLNDGTKYQLLSQFGWKGHLKNQFGFWRTSKATKKKFILFFEKIPKLELRKGINIKEGKCTDECWNFYDVKVL